MGIRKFALGGEKTQNTAVGRVLGGRYRVDGRLGKGGMAVVYRAEDALLGRKVALKILHRYYAEATYFQKRFKQEARAMASMDHENIVKIYDICQDGDVPLIVAEYVGGDDLKKLLSEKTENRLDEPSARKVAAQLLEALCYAHRRGIIHRDVKPSNILMTPEGVVKVADFGIARIVEEEDAEEPGEIVGSARYMSPEQLQGGEATPRSDVYSVGILLYHCLTGSPPFSGDLESLVHQQLHQEPTPPRELNKKISLHMESVILRALAKDPADRYASARAMLEDLDGGRRDEVVPQTLGIPRRAIRRRGRPGSLVALMLALVVTIAGLWFGAASLGYVDLPSERNAQGWIDRVQQAERNFIGFSADPAGKESSAGENATMIPVPNVDTYFDYWAEQTLVESGFEVEVVYEPRAGYTNRGVTWATEPAMGTSAPKGSTVTIYATPKELKQPRV
ncbi:MAG: protein kinase [Rubrobacteraceae bacterium]